MDALSLYDLNLLVRRAVDEQVPHEVWVTGELAEGRTAANGHFYGELVEKNPATDLVIARARITCWARSGGNSVNILRKRRDRTSAPA